LGHERRRPRDGLDDRRNGRHSCCAGFCGAADGQSDRRHSGRQHRKQTLGDQTSYTYQLAALADTLQTGAKFLIDVDDSVANAELIDEVYRRAGLSPRG
jgi:predicted dehydrogenase